MANTVVIIKPEAWIQGVGFEIASHYEKYYKILGRQFFDYDAYAKSTTPAGEQLRNVVKSRLALSGLGLEYLGLILVILIQGHVAMYHPEYPHYTHMGEYQDIWFPSPLEVEP